MLGTVQLEQQNKTNEPKQQGKEKTNKQKIMLDTVQPEKGNKTNDPKLQGIGKTFKYKISRTQCSQSGRTKPMI